MRITLAGIIAFAMLIASPANTSASEAEAQCLALNVYFEARGEPLIDRKAVAHVTVNRARSGQFPNSVCAVVYQPKQFSWTTDSVSNTPRERAAWASAQDVAQEALAGADDVTSGATYFYNPHVVTPRWAGRMQETLRTASHSYRKPRRS